MRRQVTFGSSNEAAWLDPDSIGKLVWRDGVPYRVLGIYFTGNPERPGAALCQWWVGEELRPEEGPL
jgi:hypothetical protein